ncbi:RcnB family protein [Erwinia pyri]|uniref:RcnB family protein n=1 Tax=Erwinia pyri TaxID=3062598 RepID=A0AA50HPC7_9GAMM|nr:RcnB family protein [Erwinia sp. DE2]WLS77885.1 RcnB family protein [Erwinia sp. DE2]
MKKSGTVILSALLFATASLSAFAEGPQQGHDEQVKRPPQGSQQQHGQPEGHNAQPHQSEHREPQHQQSNHQQARHAEFHRGRPLPKKYRGESYQVTDWHKRGLKAPPAGHRWQNVDGNYVLIAVATGVITSIITHQ